MALDNKKSIDLLCRIIEVSNSNLPLSGRLDQMLDILCTSLIFESIALYTLDAEKEVLCLAASINRDYSRGIRLSDSLGSVAEATRFILWPSFITVSPMVESSGGKFFSFSLPAPETLSIPGGPISTAIAFKLESIWAGVREGVSSSRRAAAPAATGAAKEVPVYQGSVKLLVPSGATMSGFILPSVVGPRLENDWMGGEANFQSR